MQKAKALFVGMSGEPAMTAEKLFGRLRTDEGVDTKLIISPGIYELRDEIATFVKATEGYRFAMMYYGGDAVGHDSIATADSKELKHSGAVEDVESGSGSLQVKVLLDELRANIKSVIFLLILDCENKFPGFENFQSVEANELKAGHFYFKLVNHAGSLGQGVSVDSFLGKNEGNGRFNLLESFRNGSFAAANQKEREQLNSNLRMFNSFHGSFDPSFENGKVGKGDFTGIWFGRGIDFAESTKRSEPFMLQSFGLGDHRYYHGGGELKNEILNKFEMGKKLLHLKGQTGSGKSSFLKASLLPELLKNQGYFGVFMNDYGRDPLTDLLDKFREWIDFGKAQDFNCLLEKIFNSVPENKIVLVLDQFERLFFHFTPANKKFVNSITAALEKFPNFRVIFSMRSESLNNDSWSSLTKFSSSPAIEMKFMAENELKDAIRLPFEEFEKKIDERFLDEYLLPKLAEFKPAGGKSGIKSLKIIPVYLQIVCDTLYKFACEQNVEKIDEDLCNKYIKVFGAGKRDVKIIDLILEGYSERIVNKTVVSPEDKNFLREVLGALVCFSNGEFYADDVTVSSLEAKFDRRREFLRTILNILENESRFLFKFLRDGQEYVRLMHDFLAVSLGTRGLVTPFVKPEEVIQQRHSELDRREQELNRRADELEGLRKGLDLSQSKNEKMRKSFDLEWQELQLFQDVLLADQYVAEELKKRYGGLILEVEDKINF